MFILLASILVYTMVMLEVRRRQQMATAIILARAKRRRQER